MMLPVPVVPWQQKSTSCICWGCHDFNPQHWCVRDCFRICKRKNSFFLWIVCIPVLLSLGGGGGGGGGDVAQHSFGVGQPSFLTFISLDFASFEHMLLTWKIAIIIIWSVRDFLRLPFQSVLGSLQICGAIWGRKLVLKIRWIHALWNSARYHRPLPLILDGMRTLSSSSLSK